MTISQLSLTDFRNLRSTTLDFDPWLNLISGDNGSGKTSLLEAIFVLCQAQSFRTHQLKQCINHGKGGFLLFGRFDSFKAGLAKNGNKLEIRLDGNTIKRRSELVGRCPVNIVNSDSFELIDGAPAKRRAFLDWCLFHVEPDYADTWLQFRHSLKQRNRLLKNRQDLKLLDYWDQHLAEPSLKLGAMRERYCNLLKRIIDKELTEVLHGIPLTLEYRHGWPQGEDYTDSLRQQRQRDIRSGFTNIGVHRDDIELLTRGKKVAEVLSRGQSKRACLALLLAALKLVNKARESRIILLIDDLHSELDLRAQTLVYKELAGMGLQMFISNINSAIPEGLEVKEFKKFHVEHGIIKPRNFS